MQHSAQLSKEVPFSDMKNYPEPSFDDPDFGLALELTPSGLAISSRTLLQIPCGIPLDLLAAGWWWLTVSKARLLVAKVHCKVLNIWDIFSN